jgi:Zn-finger domain-containing protein
MSLSFLDDVSLRLSSLDEDMKLSLFKTIIDAMTEVAHDSVAATRAIEVVDGTREAFEYDTAMENVSEQFEYMVAAGYDPEFKRRVISMVMKTLDQ